MISIDIITNRKRKDVYIQINDLTSIYFISITQPTFRLIRCKIYALKLYQLITELGSNGNNFE